MNPIANVDDTIVAIASSHDVGGARGIVRISGLDAVATVRQILQPADPEFDWDLVRQAQRIGGSILLPDLGTVPCDLMLWPDERSYTRQPTAELHTYGSLPLLQAVVEHACHLGARLAEPGEFTLRSFLSGRIDLAQAEAVLGVIDAANDREIQVALTQLAGGLSQPLTDLRDTLLNLVADLEAGLDFVDEDIEFIAIDQVQRELDTARNTIERTLDQIGARDQGGQLPRVALFGEPNVGKSSLWNALVDEGQALVDATAGTTRDYLVGTVRGPRGDFLLIDTAGVETLPELPSNAMGNQGGSLDSDGDVQTAMQRMGETQVDAANLVLLCIDGSRPLTEWECNALANADLQTLVVLTKGDLANGDNGSGWQPSEATGELEVVRTSRDDAESIANLIGVCGKRLSSLSGESSVVANTATRCRESLRLAGESIERAQGLATAEAGDELVVSELRTALDQLGLVVGAIYNDDILDRVFSRFCIGK